MLPQPLSPALCPPPSTALCYPRASSETHHHHHQPSFIAFSLSLSAQLWTSSSFIAFFNLPAGPQSEALTCLSDDSDHQICENIRKVSCKSVRNTLREQQVLKVSTDVKKTRERSTQAHLRGHVHTCCL